MSIQTELTRIINAKAAIKTSIEGKGVTVPDGTLLDGMAALIESIEAGGGGGFNFLNAAEVVSGTITPTSRILFANYGNISVTFSSNRPDKRVGCFLMYDTTLDDSQTYENGNTSLTTMSNGDLVAACCTWGMMGGSFIRRGVTSYKSSSNFASNNNFYAKKSSGQVIDFYASSANSETYINSGRTYAWVAFVIKATNY